MRDGTVWSKQPLGIFNRIYDHSYLYKKTFHEKRGSTNAWNYLINQPEKSGNAHFCCVLFMCDDFTYCASTGVFLFIVNLFLLNLLFLWKKNILSPFIYESLQSLLSVGQLYYNNRAATVRNGSLREEDGYGSLLSWRIISHRCPISDMRLPLLERERNSKTEKRACRRSQLT